MSGTATDEPLEVALSYLRVSDPMGSKLNRSYASHAVARVLRQFLESDSTRPSRITSPAPRLPGDLARRLTGSYHGFMGYWDDEGNVVVYRETVKVSSEGEILRAAVNSVVVVGRGPSPSLDYKVEIRLGAGDFFSGIWAPGSSNGYSGSLSGRVGSDKVNGKWAGGHGEGIRIGCFEWYNANTMQTADELNETLEKFRKSLDRQLLEGVGLS